MKELYAVQIFSKITQKKQMILVMFWITVCIQECVRQAKKADGILNNLPDCMSLNTTQPLVLETLMCSVQPLQV